MNNKKTSALHKQHFPAPFEKTRKESTEFLLLRQENDHLKKINANSSARNRRDNYEKDATIRKQKKHIDKLQQEVNALKVVLSGTKSSNARHYFNNQKHSESEV